MYFLRQRLGPVELAFTDRHGGVSAAPYDSLNLARESGDDPAAVQENWRRLLDDFAPDDRPFLADMHQVHGGRVCLVDDDRSGSWPPECDAVVTTAPDVVLAVRVADCVPVLLADPERGVVGAAHCGRPGLLAGVVTAAVARMRGVGAEHITAYVGPHVCGGCYEVPEKMRLEVGAELPAALATTTWGTPSLDIGAGVRSQLEAVGVDVSEAPRCTLESPDLFSYRRDRDGAGRQVGLIRIRR